jgi:hypothetical protein
MSLRRLVFSLTLSCALLVVCGVPDAAAQVETPSASPLAPLPSGVILINGAEASASGAPAAVPESGGIAEDVYRNAYFMVSYHLPADWIEKYKGPPPSDHGKYVLAQLRPSTRFKGADKGNVLITAQDLFFDFKPVHDAMEMIKSTRDGLPPYYEVERPPSVVTIAGHTFARLDYMSPAAQMHWYVLATEIRCHVVQFVFTSRDTKLLDTLVGGMSALRLPAEAGATSGTGGEEAPLCIQDYARGANVINKVDAVLPPGKYNPIPVRMIIGADGKVKHVHLISAYPDQAKSVTEALLQWRFKPYVQNGQPVEVETGILFGPAATAQSAAPPPQQAAQ